MKEYRLISILKELLELVVIGGGPAGYMAAITAAENGANSILILESTSKTLEKVRISGGGRCNITNSCAETKDLVLNYPRGEKPLLGAFSRFSTSDAIAWFSESGLELKVEKDGRIFPQSNSSADVISFLRNRALQANINCLKNMTVKTVEKINHNQFKISCKNKTIIYAKKVLIATGGNESGRKIASSLGHKVIKSVPSLFTFKLDSSWLTSCKGISLKNVSLKLIVGDKVFSQNGSLLITHWGLSGPSILKLSAFAARALYNNKYKGELIINWVNDDFLNVTKILSEHKVIFARKRISNSCPFPNIPKRLWFTLTKNIGIKNEINWANLSILCQNKLCNALHQDSHKIFSKGPYGEEFVTAGGVSLDEVNIKSMESKKCDNLYFSGEIMNIDGLTGGFNFQHCWTSGWIAGNAIAKGLKY